VLKNFLLQKKNKNFFFKKKPQLINKDFYSQIDYRNESKFKYIRKTNFRCNSNRRKFSNRQFKNQESIK
jgi:hypothetical protein